jgi:hypothetical protein
VSHEKTLKRKLSQYEVLRSDQDALRHRFISAELDLALTFVRISQSTSDEERSERNLDHARKAVEVARKYLGETNLTATMREELVEKLQKLDPWWRPAIGARRPNERSMRRASPTEYQAFCALALSEL